MVGQNHLLRVSADVLEAIIRHAFGGDARVNRAVPPGGGQVNDTRMIVLADGHRYIVRIAPSSVTAAAGPSWFTAHGLRREQAVIAAAADLASLLPVTVAHDFEHTAVDRDWVIQEMMPGRPLLEIEVSLESAVRNDLWRNVGTLIRRLHGVAGSRFGPPSFGQTFNQWSTLLAHDADGLVSDAERFSLDAQPFLQLRQAIDDLAVVLDEVTSPALIHSDLSPAHVFVDIDRAGQPLVKGLIDLEFGRFADPLSESLLALWDQQRGRDTPQRAFLQGYGREQLTEHEQIRIQLYAALTHGWWATLLAYRPRPTDAATHQMAAALKALDSRR